MHIKKFLIDFAFTFAVTLVVAAAVSFLYSLIVHGMGAIDWEHSFRMAIILGILLPYLKTRENKQKEKAA